ncbi:hypothetical protein EYF80_033348 [Liparis tanakae]|uniref:Uncharacterized protein n=1 Tax=Liparis tanakae TaxID=230148 RepID=A0A4Z2GS39_9TELE|nr:hypothetical protein EYF80_033348 [Liparis tanakae]
MWLQTCIGELEVHATRPSSLSRTAPLATSSRAAGKARCSASRIRSDRLSSVSPPSTGTASCTTMAPASTSS